MPYFMNNTFFNNSAIYGKNIAAFPCRIELIVYRKPKDNNIIYNSLYNDSELILMNISSGNDIPYVLEFQILDIYNEIVSLDSSYKNNCFYFIFKLLLLYFYFGYLFYF